MKNLYYAAVLAAIGLASCTSEEEVRTASAEQEITFKALSEKPTRTAITDASIPDQTPIYVTAYQKSQDEKIYAEYFTNREFTNGAGSQNAWHSSGANWPYNGTLDFVAYACDYNNDKVMPNSAKVTLGDKKIETLVLDFSKAAEGAAEDKLLKGKTDVIYSNVVCGKTSTSGMSMSFAHSLSWVVLNFVTKKNDPAANSYKLRRMKLHGVYLKGINTITYTYPATEGEPIAAKSTWDVSKETAKDVVFPSYEDVTDDGVLYGEAGLTNNIGIMIVPGAQTSISFEYATSMGGGKFTDWMPYTIDLSGDDAKWDAGKKYLYNVSVNAQSISFTASVSGWETTEDGKRLGKDEIIGTAETPAAGE